MAECVDVASAPDHLFDFKGQGICFEVAVRPLRLEEFCGDFLDRSGGISGEVCFIGDGIAHFCGCVMAVQGGMKCLETILRCVAFLAGGFGVSGCV